MVGRRWSKIGGRGMIRSLFKCFLLIPFLSEQAVAVVGKNRINAWEHSFPIPSGIQQRKSFWEKVFSKYNSSASLIHDMDDPNLIIDVIDFALLAGKKKDKPLLKPLGKN